MEKTLEYLRRLCSSREYAPRDIYDKALKRLNDAGSAQKVLSTLEAEGFVSASRYATAFARDKSSLSGWGSVKIRFMLLSKGIPEDIVTEALEEMDREIADSRFTRLMQQKYKTLRSDPNVKIKMLKFALSRGYGYEESNKVVSEIIHGKNEDLQQIDGNTDCRT